MRKYRCLIGTNSTGTVENGRYPKTLIQNSELDSYDLSLRMTNLRWRKALIKLTVTVVLPTPLCVPAMTDRACIDALLAVPLRLR